MPCTPAQRYPEAAERGTRGGFSLAEVLVACTFASAVAALLFGTLFVQLRLARVTAQRVLTADAVRTASLILDGEVRRIATADVRALAPDSVALRAFRGAAVPCGSAREAVRVRYRGTRQPQPSKDSVLLANGSASRAVALLDSRPAAGLCVAAPGEDVLEWRLSEGAPAGAVLLLFESGSYYLTARALRYRLGAEGRQPLTPESFSHPGTSFHLEAGALRYTLLAGGNAAIRTAWFAPAPP